MNEPINTIDRSTSTLSQRHSNVSAISHRRATGSRDPQHSNTALPCQGSSTFNLPPLPNYQISRRNRHAQLRLWASAGSRIIKQGHPSQGRVSLMGDLLGDPRQQKLPGGSL